MKLVNTRYVVVTIFNSGGVSGYIVGNRAYTTESEATRVANNLRDNHKDFEFLVAPIDSLSVM